MQLLPTLGGPFSAVSTATIATKYSFFQDFRDLQDSHTFAPLRSQNFSKKVVTILSFLNKLNNLFNSNFMKNALKLVFFFEILMKFCRNFTNIFRKCQNLRIIAENSEKIAKIWSKSRNRWDYSIVEMNYSVVSLAVSCQVDGVGRELRSELCRPSWGPRGKSPDTSENFMGAADSSDEPPKLIKTRRFFQKLNIN